MTGFIYERYEYVQKKSNVYYFLTADQKTFLGLRVYSSKYYQVTYIPYSSSKALIIDQAEAVASLAL